MPRVSAPTMSLRVDRTRVVALEHPAQVLVVAKTDNGPSPR